MLVLAGESLSGHKISEYKDIVFGVCSSSEGSAYRQIAVKKMCQCAERLGANAVVNFKMEIYSIAESVQEATAYGNAVIIDSLDGFSHEEKPKVNLSAYLPKPKTDTSPIGKIHDVGGYKFVVCPKCGTKYRVETDEKGEVHIKGFDDVDDEEAGLQVFCLRCGAKFTVPEI